MLVVYDERVNESVSLALEDLSIIQVRVCPKVLVLVALIQSEPCSHAAGAEMQPLNEHQ